MTKTGWIIRMYPHDNYSETLDLIGNYPQLKDRQTDELIVFRGMYGLDSYLIWDVFQNLPHYDFGRTSLDLKLYLEGNTTVPFFSEQFKVIDVKYDPKTSKYRLFAISHDSATLQSILSDYEVTSLNYDENRSVYRQEPSQKEMELKRETLSEVKYLQEVAKIKKSGVLVDVLENFEKIFNVEYHEHPQEEELRNFQYRSISINYDWRVIDFINYIADQNELEWFIRGRTLYIGKELLADEKSNATKPFDITSDKESKSSMFKMVFGITRPMDLLSHINKEWRCIWCKHWAGSSGGNSEGCFVRIGSGTVDKELYFRTLRGITERTLASRLLNQKLTSHSVILGSILKDEGNERYIDYVSVQKNKDLSKINTLEEVKIDRGSDVYNKKERVTRTTPYLDDGAGLLFPSTQLGGVVPPNSIIFNIEGKEESSAVGPFVMGNNNKEFKIPFKEKDDFRFRFPDGAELFYDKSKQVWFLQAPVGFVFKQAITDYDKEPIKARLTEAENMFQIYDGNILWDTVSLHMHMMDGGCFQVVPKTGPQPSDPFPRYTLICDNEGGSVTITAQNDIELKMEYSGALSSGTITINTLGTINIGSSAAFINLAGGTHELAWKSHNHLAAPATDFFGAPLLGNVATNLLGTTRTKAD